VAVAHQRASATGSSQEGWVGECYVEAAHRTQQSRQPKGCRFHQFQHKTGVLSSHLKFCTDACMDVHEFI
jgi:hypothetical protein